MHFWIPFWVGCIALTAGAILGSAVQHNHDSTNYDKLTADSDFDRGSSWGMHYCARDPLYWECLTKEQQDAAKQYAREHARP